MRQEFFVGGHQKLVPDGSFVELLRGEAPGSETGYVQCRHQERLWVDDGTGDFCARPGRNDREDLGVRAVPQGFAHSNQFTGAGIELDNQLCDPFEFAAHNFNPDLMLARVM